MGIKFRELKFREDFYSRVFNFAIFFTIAKNAKLETSESCRICDKDLDPQENLDCTKVKQQSNLNVTAEKRQRQEE